MKVFLFLFLLASIQTPAPAEPRWQPGLGFHDPKSEQAPEGVRRAADSVFQIIVVSKWTEISLSQFEKIPASEEFQHLSRYLQAINQFMLNRCREKQGRECYYPIDLLRGTGFLAGDQEGKRLWTNAHLAVPALKAVYSTNSEGFDQAVSQGVVDVPLFIFDRNGEMVGNVVDLTATYIEGPKEIEIMGAHFRFDYVELRLNRSLGTPIPIASKRDLSPSARVYAVGFPTCTQCGDTDENAFPRKEFGESDGVHQYLSVGVEIESSQDLLEKLYLDRAPLMPHVRLTNADATEGMSGSPVLNSAGEVLDIYFSTNVILHGLGVVSSRVRPSSWDR